MGCWKKGTQYSARQKGEKIFCNLREFSVHLQSIFLTGFLLTFYIPSKAFLGSPIKHCCCSMLMNSSPHFLSGGEKVPSLSLGKFFPLQITLFTKQKLSFFSNFLMFVLCLRRCPVQFASLWFIPWLQKFGLVASIHYSSRLF